MKHTYYTSVNQNSALNRVLHLNCDSCNRFTNRCVIKTPKRGQSLLNNGSAKEKYVLMVML